MGVSFGGVGGGGAASSTLGFILLKKWEKGPVLAGVAGG